MFATGSVNRVILSFGSLLLLALMCLGSLFLWLVMPVGWLWIGSQAENATGSLGLAVTLIAAGVALTIATMVKCLGWLNRKHIRLLEARGHKLTGLSALEVILVITGGLAVAAFFVWFVGFSGTSPLPLNPTG